MSLAQLSKAVLRSPAQVAASLPALMGFTPAESLVVVMTKSGEIEVTMRIDLPEDWNEAAHHVADTAARIGVDGAILAVCTDHESGWAVNSAGVGRTMELLSQAGVNVADALLIRGNRFWSFLHDDVASLGAVFFVEDSPLPQPVEESREDISARYAPRPSQIPSEAAYAAAQGHVNGSRLDVALRAREALDELSEQQRIGVNCGADLLRATIQLALQNVTVRDWLLANVVADEDQRALAEALADVALTATSDLAPRACGAAAAALAATSASTIPAGCLADQAGEDSLADVTYRAISGGINPEQIQLMLAGALPELDEAIRKEETPDDATHQDEGGDADTGNTRRVS